jgi:integrase
MRRYYGPTRARGSANWRCAWYDPSSVAGGKGRKGNLSLETPDRDAALAKLSRLRLEAAAGLAPARRGVTVGEALNRWLEAGRAWKYQTVRLRWRVVSELGEALGKGRVLDELSTEEVARWLGERHGKGAASSYNLVRSVLRSFWRFAASQGYCARLATEGIGKRRDPGRAPRALGEGEENALLIHADERMKDLVVVAIETGLRQGTLTKLRADWVRDGWLEVPAAEMKAGRALRVPVSERAALAIDRARRREELRGEPVGRLFRFSTSWVRWKFRECADAVGLYGFRFHDLRATFVSRLRERGVRVEVAARLAGHADSRVTLKHYSAVSDIDLKDAING